MNRCWIRSVMEPPPSPNHWPNGPAVTATGTREPARSGDNASAANKRVHYNKAGAGITHIAKRRAWKAATAATKRAPQRGTHMGPQTSFPNKGSVGAARPVRGTCSGTGCGSPACGGGGPASAPPAGLASKLRANPLDRLCSLLGPPSPIPFPPFLMLAWGHPDSIGQNMAFPPVALWVTVGLAVCLLALLIALAAVCRRKIKESCEEARREAEESKELEEEGSKTGCGPRGQEADESGD
ncbi:unnamed protein product [Gadus morhua 'NCC']